MSSKHLGQRLLVPLFVGGTLLGVIGSWFTYEDAVSHHRDGFVHRGEVLAGAIAGLVNATEGIAPENFVDLRLAVEEFAALEPSVLEIMIATREPFIILVSTEHAGIAAVDATIDSLTTMRRAVDEGIFGYFFDADDNLNVTLPIRPRDLEIGETVEPVEALVSGHDRSETRYAPASYRGAILLKLDWSSVRESSAVLLWQAVAINLASIVIVLLLAYWLLQRMVLKPMATIRSTLHDQENEHAEARVPALIDDEIGNLAATLNQMLDTIADRDQRLIRSRDELEATVHERTRELRAATAELVRRERLATLGQLSSTVSHELRNPLGTIRNCLFTIQRRTEGRDLDVEALLERANTGIERCNTIISELLAYASDRVLTRRTASVDDWLETALEELSLPPAVKLRYDLASGARVAFDPDALRQVIVNLVDNACQAMTDDLDPHGASPIIEVTSSIEDDSAVLCFADNGPGIPAELRERIFEPLYSTKTFGVGLGLPLVKRIVEQHDGRIEIGANPAGGARFTLRFPLVTAALEVTS